MRASTLVVAAALASFAASQVQRDWVATYQPPNAGGANLHYWQYIDVYGNLVAVSGASIEDGIDHLEVAVYNASGGDVWDRRFVGTNPSGAAGAAGVLFDQATGNLFVAGWVNNTTTGDDLFIQRIELSGTLGWNRTINLGGVDRIAAIAVRDASSFGVLASANMNPGTTDLWLSSFGFGSDVPFEIRSYDRGLSDEAVDLKVGSSSYYVLARTGTAAGSDATILQYTLPGTTFNNIWHFNAAQGGAGPMDPDALALGSFGDVAFTGRTNYYTRHTGLIPSGLPTWLKSESGSGRCIAIDEMTGSVYVGGGVVSQATGLYTARSIRRLFRFDGATIWEFLDSGGGASFSQDMVNDILVEPGGTILYCGQTRHVNGTDNIVIGRLSPQGIPLWTRTETGSNAAKLAVDPANNRLYVAGSASGAAWLGKYTLGPVAYNDSYALSENGRIEVIPLFGVLANDVYAANATAAITDAANHGTATMSPDGGFTYVPEIGYVGVDTFAYTATFAGLTSTATVSLSVNHQIDALNIVPTNFVGGTPFPCSVALTGPASNPAGDTINVFYDLGLYGPSTVVVPEGEVQTIFTVTSTPVATASIRFMQASFGGNVKMDTAIAIPYQVVSVTAIPTTLYGGQTAQGRVTINGRATYGGVVVTLEDNGPYIVVPASVTVPEGALSATFLIRTNNPPIFKTGVITARIPPSHRTLVMSINPVFLSQLTVAPTSVVGGATATGTARSNVAAPGGGLLVSLSDSSTYASVPANVTIPAGATSATFTVTTLTVPATTNVTITGFGNGVSRTTTLTVNP